jgi:hypothetical protein
VHRLWKVGERPLSANHILRAPFAFCLGHAFKLAIAKSASGVADNQYLRMSFRFLSWACVYKVAIAKSASQQYLRVLFRFLSWACVFKVVIAKSVQCVRRRIRNVLCPYLAMPFPLRMCRSRAIIK